MTWCDSKPKVHSCGYSRVTEEEVLDLWIEKQAGSR